MANSEWSTSNPSGGKYQVFLSFRGADTRHTFTISLYRALHDAGICAFFDDEEIRPGDIIRDDLVQGINDSMFYIPIFSKNYATSHWCLRELAMMVKCDSKSKEEGKEKVILPIFYDVELNDVELQTPLYEEAISNLEKDQRKFDSNVAKTWRAALKEVCRHKGFKREKGDDGDLIKSVVHEVVVKLKIRQRPVTKNLVGMKDHIVAINNLLDKKSNDVQVIVIYGMGGIGKTTLAKIIFNQLCPNFGNNCSFLEDVRETVQTEGGLVKLQKRLLSDISGSKVVGEIANEDHGIRTIGDTICNKEVLIVLDDVDSTSKIQYLIRVNSLFAGSIILVTSRDKSDKSILNASEFKGKFKDYEMTPLSEEDAIKLFCKHAFSDNFPPDNYDALSKEIASTVKGLPLALEVIGSSLFGREEKEIWEERLQSLKKTPHDDVLGKLQISYDALDENQQSIFLDVACFFVGEDKTNPMYMWSDSESGLCPNDVIDVLTKRCMMKVLDDDKFWMHDQLKDLGRKIARDEGNRLWDGDQIFSILRKTKDNEKVEALRFGVSGPRMIVTSEQIKRFPKIRFLYLYDINCQGDFTGCLPKLRWIELRYFHMGIDRYGRNQHLEATNLLHLENAVVVLLSGLQFTDDAFESLIQGARKLKILNITRNNSIHRTPTFPAHSDLEKLTIFDNFHFSEIDCSIGRLQHLTELSFESCYGLQKLPEQIGELRNLQHLSLKSCHHLIELPESISKLESLTTLDVYGTEIRNLPHSIGGLPRLSFLDLSHLPIAEMPRTMSQLCQLRTLKMFCCNKIQELPELPGSLTTLELTSKSLRTIPNLSCLNNPVELVLSDGNDVEGRSGLIQDCELPWMGRSYELRKLSFRFPSVRAPTTQLSSLVLLKELILEGVDLPTFEQIPSDLTVLELYDARGKRGHLDGLSQSEKETDIRGKRACTDGPSQSEKETDIRGKRARTDGLSQWEKETDTRGKGACTDELPECKEQQATELTDHERVAFSFPSSQKKLQKLILSGFPEVQHIQFVSTFQSLEEFSIADCSSLKKLDDLSNLKNMKQLDIRSCENLHSIKGIDELMFLRWLKIEKCRSMEMIFEASSSKIPNSCSIYIRRSGELPDCGRTYYTWEKYKAKILNGRKQVSDTEADFDTDAERDFDLDAEVDTDSEMDVLDPDAWVDTDSMESTDSETETTDFFEPGTSIGNISGAQHQVFLSFRGLDTRVFTNSLYRALVDVGIHVFRDDEDLQLGERISYELEQAMDNSGLYIPIFSKNYASSYWCLCRLAKMVENKSKDGKKFILPIFYDVKPDDVKLKTSLYSEAISNLEHDQNKKFNSEEVKKWREALQEVGQYAGWNWELRKGDGVLIKSVVHEVLVKLEPRQRRVTENLVGMQDHVAAIHKLLDINSGGVQIIMIYGKGGIGKTTLAKIIFNQLCPYFGKNYSFLDDMRNTAETKGLVELQKRLLFDIDPSEVARNIANIDQGINMIEEAICNKKVLIVLDDVDASEQIKCLIRVNHLFPGTIILVTSKDQSILNAHQFKDKVKCHEMMPLNYEDALELFCKHAFSDNYPPTNYATLSRMIVHTIKGLPLVLEVIGSSLVGMEDKEIWREKLKKLKETLDDDVLGRLRISYDALEENHQRIFLDIACFFVGENKTNPMHMWRDCRFSPEDVIAVLIKRCMIKVLDDDRFWMHDQLADLGRKIARDERSRLWDKVDFVRELKKSKDEERVEALRLSAWRGEVTVTSEQIKRCPSIRFLSLHNVDCQGDFTDCLPELRWIHLSYDYVSQDEDGVKERLMATNLLHLENAVVVDLCGLQFADDVFESLIQGARKLKVLTIKWNELIHQTPTFSVHSELEKLTIYDNFHLSEIDCSIGRLQHLTELSFESCGGLQKLPEQIGELRKLRHLSLKSCHHLIELPDSVSKLESLTTLDLYGTKIRNLPHSIGELPRLSFLDLSNAPIAEMPRTMSQLSQLRTLKMFCCNEIQELPELPGSLTSLVLTSKSLRTIPNLSCLINLVELVLSDGGDVEGRSGVIRDCGLSWIGRLSELRKLSFRFPSVRAPTTQLSSLVLLKELTLEGVDLPTFEQIPSDLTVLELYDARGKRGHLDELSQSEKETDIRGKRARTDGPSQSEKETDIRGKRARTDGPSQSEKETDIRGKRARTDGLSQSEKETDTRGKGACTDELPECKEQQATELTDHERVAFSFPSSQKKLQKLILSGFSEVQHIQFVSTFQSLEEFSVVECSSLKSLGNLSNLKNMKRLVIRSCENLHSIEGIGELKLLRSLNIENCRSMEITLRSADQWK